MKVRSSQLRTAATEAEVQADQIARWWPFSSAASEPPQEKKAPPPPEKTIQSTRKNVMASERFQSTMAMICQEAPEHEKKECISVQQEKMWCAMFARNIQKLFMVKGADPEKKRCHKINKLPGAGAFLGATWDIGHASALLEQEAPRKGISTQLTQSGSPQEICRNEQFQVMS